MESIIIGIAGGSGSGKSTFTNRLKKYFGDDVVVIYHDNYYRRQDGIPFEKRVKVNYDHPDSLETDLLVEHLKQLKEGKTIECPVYDYSQHNRSDKVIKIEPRRISQRNYRELLCMGKSIRKQYIWRLCGKSLQWFH